jgi:hypothetical protein
MNGTELQKSVASLHLEYDPSTHLKLGLVSIQLRDKAIITSPLVRLIMLIQLASTFKCLEP